MKTYKVGELEGALLDAAAAKAEGVRAIVERAVISAFNADGTLDRVLVDEDRCHRLYKSFDGTEKGGFWLHYSGKWELGGPLIERENIMLGVVQEMRGGEWPDCRLETKCWVARVASHANEHKQHRGETPLIAAMRAFVASKFGQEVEL